MEQLLQVMAESYSGPLPPPDFLRSYNEIVDDGAERVFRMAEQQAAHRQHLERTLLLGQDKRANRGQLLGFFIALAVLGLGGFLVLSGHDWAGGTVMAVDVVGLAGIFVYSRLEQGRDLAQQRPRAGRPGKR